MRHTEQINYAQVFQPFFDILKYVVHHVRSDAEKIALKNDVPARKQNQTRAFYVRRGKKSPFTPCRSHCGEATITTGDMNASSWLQVSNERL
jgi:hypothetical protein